MDAPATDVITLSELATMIFRYGVVTVLSIALIIVVHEFGHYLAARAVGVKVRKFSLGFGKELFGCTDRWGTRWCVSRLPIGGYVEIFGDVDRDNPIVWDKENNCERRLSEEELKFAYCTKKVWQRMIIVAAGPAINIFMALSLMASIYMIRGVAIIPPVVNSLAIGTASYDAGFQLGDRILEFDGKKISNFMQIQEVTSRDWENPHTYKIERNGKILTIQMTAREINFTDKKGRKRENRGRIGMMNSNASFFEHIVAVEGIETKDKPDKAREVLLKNMDKVVTVEISFREEQNDKFLVSFPSALNEHLKNPKSDYYDRIFSSDINNIEYERYDIFRAYDRAAGQIGNGLLEAYKLLQVIHKGKTEERAIGGVAVVAKYAGNSVKEGWADMVRFLAILSIGIAFINILPIPLLDGGFLIFLIYEGITGRSVSPRVQNLSFAIALVFLGGIMILANLIDLIDFINP